MTYTHKRHFMGAWLAALLILLCACGGRRQAPEEYTMEKVSFTREGQHIAGELYLPDGQGPRPLVIFCHGYGGRMDYLRHYAVYYAQYGFATCVFDFVGGGPEIQSDGTMLDMSVLTEAADLNAVLDDLSCRPEIDPAHIFLVGASQGGFVTTYVAGQRPGDVCGLVPLYPGYGMQDFLRATAKDPPDETYTMLGQTVGRRYVEDALSFRIEDSMAAYDGPVLIIHGTADVVAPLSYSKRALLFFPSARLETIEGAGHVFRGEADEEAMELMLSFFETNTKP